MGPLPVVSPTDEPVSGRHDRDESPQVRTVADVRVSIRRSCVAAGERSFGTRLRGTVVRSGRPDLIECRCRRGRFLTKDVRLSILFLRSIWILI